MSGWFGTSPLHAKGLGMLTLLPPTPPEPAEAAEPALPPPPPAPPATPPAPALGLPPVPVPGGRKVQPEVPPVDWLLLSVLVPPQAAATTTASPAGRTNARELHSGLVPIASIVQ